MQIVIHGLTKTYSGNVAALKQIDLTIGGGMFGLLGPNGAGKTTFLRIVATLMQPSHGSVTVGGYRTHDPHEKWIVKSMLGYLPQELALYGDLSAYELLEFVAALKQIAPHTRRQQIHEALEVVALADVAKRRIKTYSGGMKRRVGVAQALLGDPKLLIVDEPTVGLDPQERVRFRTMLVALARHRTIILSTHILEDIAQTCSQLAVLNCGALVFAGDTQLLLAQASGHVWEITAADYLPAPDHLVVAHLQDTASARYRVLAADAPHSAARLLEPTLEDAYLWSVQARSA